MSLTQRPQVKKGDIFSLPHALPEPFASHTTFYTMNGRNAIYHALHALGIRKGETVLLPAFHCTALVDPVLAFGCVVKFYTVHRDLSLDMNEIAEMVRQGASVLLFVHFFGYSAPVKELTELARSFSLKLIEDCTHTLTGQIDGQPVGTFGDAAIFSLRKILPVPDGGILLMKKKHRGVPALKSPLVYHLRMAKWAFESQVKELTRDEHKEWKNDVPEIQKPSVSTGTGPASHEDPQFVEQWRDWSISKISKMVLRRTDLEQVRQKRIHNFNQILKALLYHPNIKIFSKEPMPLCPLGFPFTSNSPERIDYQLRRLGVPAFSFGEDLHSSVDLGKFPDAKYLSDHLVLLPVHQGLANEDISIMLRAVDRVFQNEKTVV